MITIDNTNDLIEHLKRGAILFARVHGYEIKTAKRRIPIKASVARYVIRQHLAIQSGEAGRYIYNTVREP